MDRALWVVGAALRSVLLLGAARAGPNVAARASVRLVPTPPHDVASGAALTDPVNETPEIAAETQQPLLDVRMASQPPSVLRWIAL